MRYLTYTVLTQNLSQHSKIRFHTKSEFLASLKEAELRQGAHTPTQQKGWSCVALPLKTEHTLALGLLCGLQLEIWANPKCRILHKASCESSFERTFPCFCTCKILCPPPKELCALSAPCPTKCSRLVHSICHWCALITKFPQGRDSDSFMFAFFRVQTLLTYSF